MEEILKRLARLETEHREHVEMCKREFKEGKDQFSQIITTQQAVGRKVDECNDQLCELVANTAGIIQIYNDTMGAGRTITRIQKFILGTAKYVGIPAAVIAFFTWLFEKVPPG